MASIADIAAQLAAATTAANNQTTQSQQQWQQQLAKRPPPMAMADWEQGSWEGKPLADMGQKQTYYNNFANKYYEGDTAARNSLLKSHGLQQPNWGWNATPGVSALPGPVSWANGDNWAAMRGGGGNLGAHMSGRGRDMGLGPMGDAYGRMEDMAEDYGDRFGGTIGGIGTGDAENEFGRW